MKFNVSRNRWIILFSIVFFIAVLLAVFSFKKDREPENQKSAEIYLMENDLKRAEAEFKNILQKDPENEYAYIRLSEVYRRLNEPKNELGALLSAVAINPDNLNGQHRLAQVYLLGGWVQKAHEIANLILSKDPENIQALHLLASVLIRERNVTAAVKTLNTAIELEPENPSLYAFLGYVSYYGKKNFKEAEDAYLNAISLDRSFSEPYEELSRIYTAEGMNDQLELLLIDWTKTPGNLFQKFVRLAQFYESQNNLKKAEAAYSRLIGDSEQKDPALLHMLGLFYTRTGQFAKAILFYNQMLAMEENPDIQSELANIYFEMKQYPDARDQVSDILKKAPDHPRARLIDCKLLIAEGAYNDAIEKLDQLIAIDSTLSEAYYLKAVCLEKEELKPLHGQKLIMAASGDLSARIWKHKQAIVALRTATDKSPDYLSAQMMLADLYVKTNDLLQAEKQLESVLSRLPDEGSALVMLGDLKIQTRDWAGAEKIFRHLIDTQPGSSLAYEKLGRVLDAMKIPEQAIAAFKKALELDALNMSALNHLVSSYISTGQKETALQTLNTHLNRPEISEKEKGFIAFLFGNIALSEGKIDPAKKYFQNSIKTFSKTTPSYEALAAIEEKEDNLLGAIYYCEQILSYDSKFFPALLSLSRLFQKQDDIPKARKALENILNVQDNYAPAANDLARLLAEERRYQQKALHLARIAQSQEPDNPDYLDTLGWIYYNQKQYDLAAYKLQASLKINPDAALPNYHLGLTYFEMGKFEEGRKYLRLALKTDPNFEGSLKAKALLRD